MYDYNYEFLRFSDKSQVARLSTLLLL